MNTLKKGGAEVKGGSEAHGAGKVVDRGRMITNTSGDRRRGKRQDCRQGNAGGEDTQEEKGTRSKRAGSRSRERGSEKRRRERRRLSQAVKKICATRHR